MSTGFPQLCSVLMTHSDRLGLHLDWTRTAIRVKKWGSKPAVGSQLKKLTQLGNLHARLKPGARVDVIVEADSNATLKKP
jgi:hypothetical protein